MLSLMVDRCSSYVDAEASKWVLEDKVQEQGEQCRLEFLHPASIRTLPEHKPSST